jgi:hypothetical protein
MKYIKGVFNISCYTVTRGTYVRQQSDLEMAEQSVYKYVLN